MICFPEDSLSVQLSNSPVLGDDYRLEQNFQNRKQSSQLFQFLKLSVNLMKIRQEFVWWNDQFKTKVKPKTKR